MLTGLAVGVQWERVIVYREQARSHRGSVNTGDPLWERDRLAGDGVGTGTDDLLG